MMIKRRIDFVYLFDCQDGNPNGLVDGGGPRIDTETGQCLVTDVCIKRHVRDYASLKDQRIYIANRAILSQIKAEAYRNLGLEPVESDEETPTPAEDDASPEEESAKSGNGKTKKKEKAKKVSDYDRVLQVQRTLADNYWDIRVFGAVMGGKGADAGQMRGTLQMTFARSVDPVLDQEHSITRVAVETEEEANKSGGRNHTIGKKSTIPYGLFVAHGFVVPMAARVSGCTEEDIALAFEGLWNCWDNARSAARGLMGTRAIIAFEHENMLGNARAVDLFKRVKATLRDPTKPPRMFEDYKVEVFASDLPKGVKIVKV
jgi:CRISPR-associated protein Csd2